MDFMTALEIIISASLLSAAPLIFTALGGVFSERSGVVNIGLEGLMIIGAFTSIVFNLTFSKTLGAWTPWIALVVAMLVSGIFALIHALATISFRADQTVSGIAINFLALGLAMFLIKKIYGKGQTDTITEYFRQVNIPGLSHIPIIGPLLFKGITYPSYLALIVAFIVWYILFKTPFGLRLRAVGEHPMAADTMGINVIKMRYMAVFLSGIFGGIGGAIYAQSITLNFSQSTISGQGYMALAAMIFGKWNPLGAMGAALFFGFAQSLSIIGNSIAYLKDIPSVFLLIAPYVLTILALAGFIGRADAPKASGIPYIKGER